MSIGHTNINRGITRVYWNKGTCESVLVTENRFGYLVVSSGIGFPFLVALLLSIPIIRRTSFGKFFAVSKFQRVSNWFGKPQTQSILPDEVTTATISGFLFVFFMTGSIYAFGYYIFMDRWNNYGLDMHRCIGIALGYMAFIFLGIAVLTANKTLLWEKLIRVPFERVMKFHKYCATSAVLYLTLHSLIQFYFWGSDVILTSDYTRIVGRASPMFGFVAGCSFWAVSITSLPIYRKYRYNSFTAFHKLFIVGMLFTGLHYPNLGLYVCGGPMVLYLIDHIMRHAQMYLETKVVSRKLIGAEYLEIEVQMSDLFFQAEDHARRVGVFEVTGRKTVQLAPTSWYWLNIPEVKAGKWHPMAVSSFEEDRIKFLIRKMDEYTWSDVLYSRIDRSLPTSVHVRGPYSSRPQIDVFDDKYSDIYLIAGGVGASVIMHVLERLIYNCSAFPSSRHARRHVHLIIVTRNRVLLERFNSRLEQYAASTSPRITVKPYLTSRWLKYNAADDLKGVSKEWEKIPDKRAGNPDSSSKAEAAETPQRERSPIMRAILSSLSRKSGDPERSVHSPAETAAVGVPAGDASSSPLKSPQAMEPRDASPVRRLLSRSLLRKVFSSPGGAAVTPQSSTIEAAGTPPTALEAAPDQTTPIAGGGAPDKIAPADEESTGKTSSKKHSGKKSGGSHRHRQQDGNEVDDDDDNWRRPSSRRKRERSPGAGSSRRRGRRGGDDSGASSADEEQQQQQTGDEREGSDDEEGKRRQISSRERPRTSGDGSSKKKPDSRSDRFFKSQKNPTVKVASDDAINALDAMEGFQRPATAPAEDSKQQSPVVVIARRPVSPSGRDGYSSQDSEGAGDVTGDEADKTAAGPVTSSPAVSRASSGNMGGGRSAKKRYANRKPKRGAAAAFLESSPPPPKSSFKPSAPSSAGGRSGGRPASPKRPLSPSAAVSPWARPSSPPPSSPSGKRPGTATFDVGNVPGYVPLDDPSQDDSAPAPLSTVKYSAKIEPKKLEDFLYYDHFYENILTYGRPDIEKIILEGNPQFTDLETSEAAFKDTAVFACGPPSLSMTVRGVCTKYHIEFDEQQFHF
jgi:predicted ferric reductase